MNDPLQVVLEKAKSLYEEDRIEESSTMFQLIANDSNSSSTQVCEAFFNLGLISFLVKGDLGTALLLFDRCLDINKEHSDALFNRASVKLNQQNATGAIQDLNLYISLNPNDTEAYQNR